MRISQQKEIAALRNQVQNLRLDIATLENNMVRKDSVILHLKDSLNQLNIQNDSANESLKILATFTGYAFGDVSHWFFTDSKNTDYDFLVNLDDGCNLINDDGDGPNEYFIGKIFEIHYHEGQLDIGWEFPVFIDALIIDSLTLLK